MPPYLTYARPVGAALVGMVAMLGTWVAYDPPWFGQYAVLLTVNHTAWGLLYFAERQG